MLDITAVFAGSILGFVAYLCGYWFGYANGCGRTAEEQTERGRKMFDTNVWWGAQIARKHPCAKLEDIPDLVRKRQDQLVRLSYEELIAVSECELKSEKSCHDN